MFRICCVCTRSRVYSINCHRQNSILIHAHIILSARAERVFTAAGAICCHRFCLLFLISRLIAVVTFAKLIPHFSQRRAGRCDTFQLHTLSPSKASSAHLYLPEKRRLRRQTCNLCHHNNVSILLQVTIINKNSKKKHYF